ncbi:hypothetical protein SAMN04244548_01210 [Paracoccus pantotrophus]|nr:hypothetical protein SAMN04244548_01210 [Paracoccus pantotrophus]
MPIGINAVRSALTAGDRIMVTKVSEPESKAGTFYALKAAGKTVPRNTFAKLRDELEPADRGLFDGEPQSFVLKPGA